MKKSYSLSTLLLLMVIAALIMSQIVMMWRLADARSELELNRRRFGYIHVDDESKSYVARIPEPNAQEKTSYRIRVPAGSRYLLHLTDTTFSGEGYPTNPVPTRSISLNSWRDGADVILSYCIYWKDNAPRLNVHTETEEFFDYVPPDWTNGGPSESTRLESNPQNEYPIDKTIEIMSWRDSRTKRGLMLWLEPYSSWNARRLGQKAASQQTGEGLTE